jgi:hypothetical protein
MNSILVPSPANGLSVDGHTFKTRAAKERYLKLKREASSGVINNLIVNKHFPIVVNDVHVTTFFADFVYSKPGVPTEVYEVCLAEHRRGGFIKEKLFVALFGAKEIVHFS